MEHEDTIPYYHNNIDENAQKIHTLLGNLLQKYGSVTDTKIYLRTFIAGTDEPETFVVPYLKLEWEDSDLQIRYVAGGFVEEAEKLKYNDQIDWTRSGPSTEDKPKTAPISPIYFPRFCNGITSAITA